MVGRGHGTAESANTTGGGAFKGRVVAFVTLDNGVVGEGLTDSASGVLAGTATTARGRAGASVMNRAIPTRPATPMPARAPAATRWRDGLPNFSFLAASYILAARFMHPPTRRHRRAPWGWAGQGPCRCHTSAYHDGGRLERGGQKCVQQLWGPGDLGARGHQQGPHEVVVRPRRWRSVTARVAAFVEAAR